MGDSRRGLGGDTLSIVADSAERYSHAPPTGPRSARASRWSPLLALLLVGARPTPPPLATWSVRVRVRDATLDRPLPNAQVVNRDDGAARFTDARGEVLLSFDRATTQRLRVRQLGYVYVDTAVVPSASDARTVDSITVTLNRVVYQLGGVAVKTARACNPIESPALTAAVLAQLRQGAERYLAFRDAYPFRVRQIRRTAEIKTDAPTRIVREQRERAWSERWGQLYEPDDVVQRNARGFSVPLLFIAALADSVFWDRHCFSATGVEELNGTRVVRLEFSPTGDAKSADWSGAALVDSATSVLRRVEFRLAGLRPGDLPARLEGYTTFTTPAHLVVVPESTIAMWWRHAPDSAQGWGPPHVGQLLFVEGIDFTKRAPPVTPAPPPPL